MDKVLSELDIEYMERDIDTIEKFINEQQKCLTTIINSFENEEIVQNLYEVGKFGIEQKERLQKIKEGIDEFHTLINREGGLVAKTKEFLESAKALNQTGKEQ